MHVVRTVNKGQELHLDYQLGSAHDSSVSQIDGPLAEVAGLRQMLSRVRRRAVAVWWFSMLLGPIGAAGLALLAAVGIDHLLVLPPFVRLLLLLSVLSVVVVALRGLVRRRPATGDEQVALLIERRFPSLDNSLINGMQLAERSRPDDRAWVSAVANDAAEHLRVVKPMSAVSQRGLWVSLGGAAGALMIALVVGISNGGALSMGLERVLTPYADNTLTKIERVLPGDVDVLLHSDVKVEAVLSGRVPTQVRLETAAAEGGRVIQAMAAPSDEAPDYKRAVIGRVEQGLRYRVVAGDDRSPWYQIRVHRRPTVEQILQTIRPPAYVGSAAVHQTGGVIEVLAGSQVELAVHASQPVSEGRLRVDGGMVLPLSFTDLVGRATMQIDRPGRYTIELVGRSGFESEPVSYEVVPLADQPPRVTIVEPAEDLVVDIDAKVVVQFEAEDDWAVREVALMAVGRPAEVVDGAGDDALVVKKWVQTDRTAKIFGEQVTVSVAELGLSESRPIELRAVAWDFREGGPKGESDVLTIRLRAASGSGGDGQSSADRASLGQLIEQQKRNIAASRGLLQMDGEDRDEDDAADGIDGIVGRQELIRTDAMKLVERLRAETAFELPGSLAGRLDDLVETLMALAIEQLRGVRLAGDVRSAMDGAIQTQQSILAALQEARQKHELEKAQRRQRQVAELLQRLIAKQKALRSDTAGATQKEDGGGSGLAHRQKVLSRDAVRLQSLVREHAEAGAGGNPQLAERYVMMADGFEQRRVRANMIIAAERLGDDDGKGAAAKQDQVLEDLAALEALLRQAMLAEAKQEAKKLIETLEDAKQRVDKLEKVQKAIAEIARQLHETKDLTDGIETDPTDLADLVEARKDVADAVEALVTDMHLLADQSVSNDLLNELNEIYEDVKQAEGSEDAPISDIAVDRDDGLLAMLRQMQKEMDERLADLEMWLMDKPDTLKWMQESWDQDEIGEIPLGDLPDSLEDIVGDLVEQSEQLSKEAEDSVSNVGLPDMTMGWDIMDGPMPSWAAKGKSGNERPNSNEQTGRSGSGRQGKSSGELVGDTIKALEGAEVDARRTQDAFQAGQLKEEEPGFMDTKATGGGKMAGTSDREGMSGTSPPRNELAYRKLAGKHEQLKQSVETVYSKAKLLRLPTGELDRAVLELETASRRLDERDLAGFAQHQQKVVKALRQTKAGLAGKAVTIGPSGGSSQADAEAGATGEPVPVQYENDVAQYMRQIAQ